MMTAYRCSVLLKTLLFAIFLPNVWYSTFLQHISPVYAQSLSRVAGTASAAEAWSSIIALLHTATPVFVQYIYIIIR